MYLDPRLIGIFAWLVGGFAYYEWSVVPRFEPHVATALDRSASNELRKYDDESLERAKHGLFTVLLFVCLIGWPYFLVRRIMHKLGIASGPNCPKKM